MAVQKKPVPKGAGGSRAVSMDPDSFVSGGLHTDFDGVVVEARTAIWNYDNGGGPKMDDQGNPIFGSFAKLVIVDKEDGQQYTSYYSAAYVDAFVPGDADENEVPRDESGCCEGVCFVPAKDSTKTALGMNTNYAQLLTDLRTAGFKEQFKPDITTLEGIAGHWDRVPVRKKGGSPRLQEEASGGGRQRSNDVLVCTRYDGRESAPAAESPKQATKPTPVSTVKSDGGLDEKLTAIVQAALPTDGTPISRKTLAGKVMPSKALTAAEKSKGVTRIGSNEFLAAGMESEPPLWLFDVEEGTVQAYVE